MHWLISDYLTIMKQRQRQGEPGDFCGTCRHILKCVRPQRQGLAFWLSDWTNSFPSKPRPSINDYCAPIYFGSATSRQFKALDYAGV